MKVTDLNIPYGRKIRLFVKRYEDGSGSAMGPGVDNEMEYLHEVIWKGPIYDGTMGQAAYIDGTHIGIPISAEAIILANPKYGKK